MGRSSYDFPFPICYPVSCIEARSLDEKNTLFLKGTVYKSTRLQRKSRSFDIIPHRFIIKLQRLFTK